MASIGEFKPIIQIIIHKICTLNEAYSTSNTNESQSTNLYHLFLRFLFLNLKETSVSSNASVWRTFKGRLYTRLHDKRIGELDLSGFINLAYLFLVLIKCFSGSATLAIESQLKYEQLENYFRILNVFLKAKNLQKIDQILSLNTSLATNQSSTTASSLFSAKLNAIKTIFTTKFVALRLWYESNDANNSNNEDIETVFIKQEFVNVINEWLVESTGLIKTEVQPQNSTGSNQINRFNFEF